MGRYNFNGDLGDASEKQLEFIGEILEKNGIIDPEVTLETVGAAGDNYIASVKRIVVNNDGTPLKMIVKLATKDPATRLTLHTGLLFRNEHIIYTEVLPKFEQLQLEADVKEEDRVRFPKCYGSLSEEFEETIILEDLTASGFVTVDRFKRLNEEYVKSVLKSFAVFHSLSFVLKNKEPDTFSAMADQIQEVYSASTFSTEMSMNILDKNIMETVQKSIHKKALTNIISEMGTLATKNHKIEKGSKHSVIRQGDAWITNIMFKLNNDTPLANVIIDYQMAAESSPVYDIMTFIFSSTDHEHRQKFYYEYIDYYYNELEKSLRLYGLNSSQEYPRDQYKADLKRYGKQLLGLTVFISLLSTRKNEDAAKMKENLKEEITEEKVHDTFNSDQDTEELFKKRLEGLVDSFLEFGLLQ